MRIAYSRTAAHSYMIVRDLDFQAPDYELKMMRYNHIPKLLDLQIIEDNGNTEYWYEITGLQSLSSQMELYPVNYLKLRELTENICDLKENLERYFLDEDNLWYSPEMVFQDRRSRQFLYCYIPGSHASRDGLKALMEEVLNHLDHSDPQAVKAAYEIYDRAAAGNLGIRDLMRGILTDQPLKGPVMYEGWEGTDSEWFPTGDLEADAVNISQFLDEEENDLPKKPRFPMPGFLARHRQGRGKAERGRRPEDDFWEHTDRIAEAAAGVGYGETEFLNVIHQKPSLQFIYQGNGREQNFYVDHFPFVVGKDPGAADHCLKSPSASRLHARILQNGQEFFLQDENSTNGTYLNGEILPYHTPVQLQNNDRVIFGTEEYLVVFGRQGSYLRFGPEPEDDL